MLSHLYITLFHAISRYISRSLTRYIPTADDISVVKGVLLRRNRIFDNTALYPKFHVISKLYFTQKEVNFLIRRQLLAN